MKKIKYFLLFIAVGMFFMLSLNLKIKGFDYDNNRPEHGDLFTFLYIDYDNYIAYLGLVSNNLDDSNVIIFEKGSRYYDEASSIFPNQPRKSDENITYAFRWFRHFTDGTLILADQSIGDIDIAIRRRVNIVYNFSGFRKIPFLCYWIDVNKINYIEDIITNINNINDFKTNKIFGFFGKRRFSSRYMKRFYNPMKENINNWSDLVIDPEEINKIGQK